VSGVEFNRYGDSHFRRATKALDALFDAMNVAYGQAADAPSSGT
jgi:hypothetical protein